MFIFLKATNLLFHFNLPKLGCVIVYWSLSQWRYVKSLWNYPTLICLLRNFILMYKSNMEFILSNKRYFIQKVIPNLLTLSDTSRWYILKFLSHEEGLQMNDFVINISTSFSYAASLIYGHRSHIGCTHIHVIKYTTCYY